MESVVEPHRSARSGWKFKLWVNWVTASINQAKAMAQLEMVGRHALQCRSTPNVG